MSASINADNEVLLTRVTPSLEIAPGTPAFTRAEEIWARVVELEEAFWPVGGDELTLLAV